MSDEPLDIIRLNECEAPLDLATSRFRRLWNEIEGMRALLRRIEWSPAGDRCSVCAATVWRSDIPADGPYDPPYSGDWRYFVHAPGCELAALIR